MASTSLSILIIVISIIIVAVIVFTIVTFIEAEKEAQTNPIVNPQQHCSRDVTQLVDVSSLPCCCLAGNQTNFLYIESLDVVVGPSPTYYLDACAGFCQGGNFNPNTETCLTGPSQKFQSCVSLTKPVNCIDSAMPVGVDGIQYYYVHSATQAECMSSGNCAPQANTCPNNGGEPLFSIN